MRLWFHHRCWAEAIKHRCEQLHQNILDMQVTAIIQAAKAKGVKYMLGTMIEIPRAALARGQDRRSRRVL